MKNPAKLCKAGRRRMLRNIMLLTQLKEQIDTGSCEAFLVSGNGSAEAYSEIFGFPIDSKPAGGEEPNESPRGDAEWKSSVMKSDCENSFSIANDIGFYPYPNSDEFWTKPKNLPENEQELRKNEVIELFGNPFEGVRHQFTVVVTLPGGQAKVMELVLESNHSKGFGKDFVEENYNPKINTGFGFLDFAKDEDIFITISNANSAEKFPISLEEARQIAIHKVLPIRFMEQLIERDGEAIEPLMDDPQHFLDYVLVSYVFSDLEKQERDSVAFAQAVAFLKSEKFKRKIAGKNLSEERKVAILAEYVDSTEEELMKRADDIIERAKVKLAEFCGDSGDIFIPFSAGRDSSIVTILASRMFPERTIYLINVSPGFGKNSENPRSHSEFLIKRFGLNNVVYRSENLSALNNETMFGNSKGKKKAETVDLEQKMPVAVDSKKMGYPVICTLCKMGMEMAVHYLVKQIYESNGGQEILRVLWGYISAQGEQGWPEQTPWFRDAMDRALTRLGLNTTVLHGTPLSELFSNPGDSTLVLARLGLYVLEHKNEGGCLAAGTNPKAVNGPELRRYVEENSDRVFNAVVNNPSNEGNVDLSQSMRALINTPGFTEGAYDEKR